MKNKIHRIAYSNKIPLALKITSDGQYKVYNHHGYGTITAEYFTKIRSNQRLAKYIIIDLDNKLTLKEMYENFIIRADNLFIKTKGTINMYRTGTISKTALNLFYQITDIIPEKITALEADWIEAATIGPLTIAKVYKGPAYKYDFISSYPSIMKDPHMLFPVKEGIEEKITKEEFKKFKFYPYGIYKCKVIKSTNISINYLFKFNGDNTYTHIDLSLAKDLGLKIKIIINNQPNALFYSRDKLIQGHKLFGKYVDYLFPLKEQKTDGAKSILNALWGILCKKNIITIKTPNKGPPLEIYKDTKIVKFEVRNNDTIAYCVKNDNYYETDFARLKPFLLSKGRSKIAREMLSHIDSIVYSHTDSIISTKKLNIKTGKKIGELRYEGFCQNFYCKNIIKKTKNTSFTI